ncbi:hypothetical protein KPL74_13655 [Bacillus sp. NP157]|nr:hypothetical protein KPL74_13655 [Bacillus sp. NP157]
MNTDATPHPAAQAAPPASVPRRRRRWLVHVAWLIVTLAALVGGIYVGMGWGTQAIIGITSGGNRAAAMRRLYVTLDAADSDDVAKLRLVDRWMVKRIVEDLASIPRYGDCKPEERETLGRAKAWLAANDPVKFEGQGYMRELAFRFCDKPAEVFRFF